MHQVIKALCLAPLLYFPQASAVPVDHIKSDAVIIVIVERHPTLAARDAYAARGGYVSKRAAKVITYDKEHGEVGSSTVLPR